MIKNDKQLHITKSRLKEFEESIEALKDEEIIDPILREIQLDALNSQMETFEREIREYQRLKEGKISFVTIDSFTNIHEALIKGRIARGWTQAELAQRMNLKEQQIQRYEAGNYITASMPRIIQVLETLDMEVHPFKIDIGNKSGFDLPDNIDIDQINARVKQAGSLLPVC